MRGQKHLIKCRCILPQFKGIQNPPTHRFVVFSVIKEDDIVQSKYVQCNNCGIVHKVTDICVSDIIQGKEAMASIVKVEDIKLSLPSNLTDILDRNSVDIATWEHAQFILENKQWGNFVILAQEEEAGTKQGKYVRIMSETFFKVESFSREEVVVPLE
jgi:hypothetical protein